MVHDNLVCAPPDVRFTLSFRDVEDLLAERGLDVSYETVRRWVLKFGPLFARELRRRRHRPTTRWHLDEMAMMIAGRQFCSGGRSTMKARFSICSCNDDATRRQP
jgi:transposase-like protein